VVDTLLAAVGAEGAAAARAREAAELLAEAGDGEAVPVARRALERDPGRPDGLRWLAGIEARFVPAAAEVTLRRALAEQPGDPSVEAQLLGLLDREGRQGARARLLLDRARRQAGPAARAGLRREAARLLAATGEADDAALAADTLLAVTSDLPDDGEALREAASALMACDRASEAVPLLAALRRAHPDDQALAEQLERAGGPRRPPPLEPAVDSIEEAFSSQDQLPGPVGEPTSGPRTLEFPALERPDAETPMVESPAGAPEPERPPEPVPAPAFEAMTGPRTLEFPAMPLPPVEERPAAEQAATGPTPLEPGAPSRDMAHLPESATDPASRASAWLASASSARRSGAPVEEVRLAIQQACESEPDAPAPWAALADLELAHGDAIAAARAYLAVSIRTEGIAAADAALVAARLFLEQGHAPEAVRALRAATLGEPTSAPPALVQAVEAMASGWPEAATRLLALVAPDELGVAARAVRDQLHLMLDWSAGVLEIADLEHRPELDTVPGAAGEKAIPDWTWDSAESAESVEPTASAEATPPPPPGQAEAGVEAVAAIEPPEPAPGGADSLRLLLRAEADATSGSERAGVLEQLAGLLERAGDLGAAADSLMEAVEADADRELTWGWLESLVAGDADRETQVAALRRAATPGPPVAIPPPPVSVAVPPVATPPAEALERALEMARQDPANADALLEVAALARQLAATAAPFDHDRLAELARLAGSIAAFVAPDRAGAPEAPPLAVALSEAARDRVALPEVIGPLGKLLSLLTPHLEPLFPADLQRLGITAANRLEAPRSPQVREPLETTAGLLSARAHATFLVDRPGALITLENTRPPAVIVPAGFVALPLGARRFLATRALDQLERGGALVGKFAPRDVGILLELACRFAGGKPPPLGLPAARAGAFLSAMARAVPPVLAARVTALGPPAAEELAGADLGAFAEALQRTSARVALLATGDPAGAFAALVAIEASQPPSGAAALRLPALRELATLALSEPFLVLRVAVVG
jgi:tetratricopeptide (TPR) repeat protein